MITTIAIVNYDVVSINSLLYSRVRMLFFSGYDMFALIAVSSIDTRPYPLYYMRIVCMSLHRVDGLLVLFISSFHHLLTNLLSIYCDIVRSWMMTSEGS